MFHVHDHVHDKLGNLGDGKIIDIYANRGDDPIGVLTAICEFVDADGEKIVADRLYEDIELIRPAKRAR